MYASFIKLNYLKKKLSICYFIPIICINHPQKLPQIHLTFRCRTSQKQVYILTLFSTTILGLSILTDTLCHHPLTIQTRIFLSWLFLLFLSFFLFAFFFFLSFGFHGGFDELFIVEEEEVGCFSSTLFRAQNKKEGETLSRFLLLYLLLCYFFF